MRGAALRHRDARLRRLAWLGTFLGANVAALALVLYATWQPWTAATGENAVPESLVRKWLPLALALATLGTAFVAARLPHRGRQPFLYRHFLLYLASPFLLLFLYASDGRALNGQLGAIYLLAGIAFAIHALHGLWRVVEDLRDRTVALRLAGIALVVYLVLLPYHRAVMPTASDEPHYLLITQSLLYDGDLDLRNDYEGDRYSAFYPARLPDMHGVEVGRAVYPIRDLALPLLSVLPFAVAGRLGVLALMCLVGAALAFQLYMLLRDLRFAPRVAFLAVATTTLTHPILTYTTQVYPDLVAALVFVTAVRLLRHGERATPRELALASLLTALLPWLTTRAWLVAVGLGLVIAYATLRPLFRLPRRDQRAAPRVLAAAALRVLAAATLRILAGAGPFVALVLMLAYVNWRMFGLFLPSAGYFIIREQQQVLAYTPHVGALGLLFDRVFGLIPRAPVYLLAFLGAFALVRRARTHGAELAALFAGWVVSFAYIANIAYWWADGSPPSRYLLATIPFLVVGLAGGWEVIERAGRCRPVLTAVAWVLVAASAFVTYVYAVLPNLRYDLALDIRETGSPGALFSFLGRLLEPNPGLIFPSLVRPDIASIVLSVAWLSLAIGLALRGRWVLRARGGSTTA